MESAVPEKSAVPLEESGSKGKEVATYLWKKNRYRNFGLMLKVWHGRAARGGARSRFRIGVGFRLLALAEQSSNMQTKTEHEGQASQHPKTESAFWIGALEAGLQLVL